MLDLKKEVVDRFLRYVQIFTTSDPISKSTPSTERQFKLARLLVEELKEIGIENASVDEKCVVYAAVPGSQSGNTNLKIPTICFSAHLDTSPDEPGENVKPQIHTFDGGDIVISSEKNIRVIAEDIPNAEFYVGTEFISADGTTLLGADDKAGIAEIMTSLAYLHHHPEINHGELKIVFSPDEEIGKGAAYVDIEHLNADFGYTVDGGPLGELESECFNAANGKITIHGYNVHPGSAFGKMKNSLRVISEVLELFPANQAPETTQNYEGYFHPHKITADVNFTKIQFLLRSFDQDELSNFTQKIELGVAQIQEKFPDFKLNCEIRKRYRNMKEIVDQHPHIMKIAQKAILQAGIQPRSHAIRGGTDGAQFSFRGLPTPNLFTGGLNYHSKKEICSVMAMEKAVETILNIITITFEEYSEK